MDINDKKKNKIFDNRILNEQDGKSINLSKPLIDKRELAKLINVSLRCIDRWVIQKKIPHIKLEGWLVRFELSAIENWIKERSLKYGY